MGFVFFTPSGVRSYTHDRITEITNPIHKRTNINFNVQSGSPNGSAIISTNSRRAKEAAAYTGMIRMTRLRFISCQNLKGLSAISYRL